MRQALIWVMTGGLWPSGAAASELAIYECVLNPSSANAIIADFVFVGHDPEADRVVVSDALILTFNDRTPVEGRVATDNDRRITFVWELRLPLMDGTTPRTQYRLTYQRATGAASVSARPLGRELVFQAAGECRAGKRK